MAEIRTPQHSASLLSHTVLHPFVCSPEEKAEKKSLQSSLLSAERSSTLAAGI